MLAASVTTLADTVKPGPGTLGHPALDVFGKPAPDGAPVHAGQHIYDQRDADAPAARAAHERAHSLPCSAGRGPSVQDAGGSGRTGIHGSLRRRVTGKIWVAGTRIP